MALVGKTRARLRRENESACTFRPAKRGRMKMEIDMRNSRDNKPPKQPNYFKRRTFAEGKAQVDAAPVATWWLYCEVLAPLSERGLPTASALHGRAGRPPHARPAERAARRACRPQSGSRRSRR